MVFWMKTAATVVALIASTTNSNVGALAFSSTSFMGSSLSISNMAGSTARRRTTTTTTSLSMQTPIVNNWKLSRGGQVVGTVKNHPVIEDGDTITTSQLADPDGVKPNTVVKTKSGSQYKLGNPAAGFKLPKSKPTPTPPKANGRPVARKAAVLSNTGEDKNLKKQIMEAKAKYKLNGQKVGKYLLANPSKRSTSGKSTIWTAYEPDRNGLPTGTPLIVKVSPSKDRLEREAENYRKITTGLTRGQFVKFVQYVTPAGNEKPFDTQVALVLERGNEDLKAYLARNGPFKGKPLREAAVAAVQCLQACHSAKLVWTDMKTENFVVQGERTLRGIDLESAMPVRDNPVDYSPEACPPEFAQAFLNGDGPYFVLEYSYDIWSLGMFFYEIATGVNMFDKKSPIQITRLLKEQNFVVDVSAIEDENLQDLISSCLQVDPKKRPSMAQILLHPYFLTTGVGPFSF